MSVPSLFASAAATWASAEASISAPVILPSLSASSRANSGLGCAGAGAAGGASWANAGAAASAAHAIQREKRMGSTFLAPLTARIGDITRPVRSALGAPSRGRDLQRRGTTVAADGDDAERLARAGRGDRDAMGELFGRWRPRLEWLVELRLDPRLRGRLDPADVLQEAWLDVSRRFDDWAKKPDMPLFLWVRFLTVQKLAELHRRHGAQQRDAWREVPLHAGPTASADSLAERLAGSVSSPSRGLAREELLARVRGALAGLDAIDREVLAMRHFEELTNGEVASVLGITPAGASNRYVRALKRLREALGEEGA